MTGGYVKLFRSIESWEWYTDSNTKSLFLHCLIRSNHKANKWRGSVIEPGSFVTSLESLSAETGLSIRSIRTSLSRLKATGEILIKTTNRFTQLYVVKWVDFQGQDDDDDKQTTNKRQTNDKQTTTNKNDKNEKNDKNTNKEGGFTPPTVSEVSDFITEMKYGVDAQRFVSFYASKNWMVGKNKMKDWRSAVTGWNTRDNQKTGRVEPIPDYGTETKMTPEQIEELKARLKRT